ncbi:hypothetical protein D9M73_267860 [compost metagenome]
MGRIGAAAEVEFATFQAVVLQQLVVQVLAAGQQAPGMLQHELALTGQAEVAAASLDQNAVQVAFQGLDTAAEGRLAEIDSVGGADKTTEIGQGYKVTQLA